MAYRVNVFHRLNIRVLEIKFRLFKVKGILSNDKIIVRFLSGNYNEKIVRNYFSLDLPPAQNKK